MSFMGFLGGAHVDQSPEEVQFDKMLSAGAEDYLKRWVPTQNYALTKIQQYAPGGSMQKEKIGEAATDARIEEGEQFSAHTKAMANHNIRLGSGADVIGKASVESDALDKLGLDKTKAREMTQAAYTQSLANFTNMGSQQYKTAQSLLSSAAQMGQQREIQKAEEQNSMLAGIGQIVGQGIGTAAMVAAA